MAFYDSVKDDVQEEHGDGTEDSEDENMAFDQLKEDADAQEGSSEQAEQQQDDDDIMVLRSDEEVSSQDGGSRQQRQRAPQQSGSAETSTDAVAHEQVLESLQAIEQQNAEMLDVLRGIKRSLDQ